jgi:hypothetical protein
MVLIQGRLIFDKIFNGMQRRVGDASAHFCPEEDRTVRQRHRDDHALNDTGLTLRRGQTWKKGG